MDPLAVFCEGVNKAVKLKARQEISLESIPPLFGRQLGLTDCLV